MASSASAHPTGEPDCVDPENRTTNMGLRRGQWIRAAILGANDGLLSTTSLMLGIGAAKEDRRSMVLAGLAGALSGACSMAVGEFVSVSTQRDIQRATSSNRVSTDRVMSKQQQDVASESQIFSPGPGRSPMMKVIISDDHQDEEEAMPNPFQAAAASALAFLCGSIVPLVPAILCARYVVRVVMIAIVTSIALVVFGGFGAHLGGSAIRVSALRVLAGGWVAMGVTYGLLKPFDTDEGKNDSD